MNDSRHTSSLLKTDEVQLQCSLLNVRRMCWLPTYALSFSREGDYPFHLKRCSQRRHNLSTKTIQYTSTMSGNYNCSQNSLYLGKETYSHYNNKQITIIFNLPPSMLLHVGWRNVKTKFM